MDEVNWSIQDGNKWIPIDERNIDYVEVRDRILNGEQYSLDEEFRSEFISKISE